MVQTEFQPRTQHHLPHPKGPAMCAPPRLHQGIKPGNPRAGTGSHRRLRRIGHYSGWRWRLALAAQCGRLDGGHRRRPVGLRHVHHVPGRQASCVRAGSRIGRRRRAVRLASRLWRSVARAAASACRALRGAWPRPGRSGSRRYFRQCPIDTVPYRQGVRSCPILLRVLFAHRPQWLSRVLGVVARAHHRREAPSRLPPARCPDGGSDLHTTLRLGARWYPPARGVSSMGKRASRTFNEHQYLVSNPLRPPKYAWSNRV